MNLRLSVGHDNCISAGIENATREYGAHANALEAELMKYMIAVLVIGLVAATIIPIAANTRGRLARRGNKPWPRRKPVSVRKHGTGIGAQDARRVMGKPTVPSHRRPALASQWRIRDPVASERNEKRVGEDTATGGQRRSYDVPLEDMKLPWGW